MELIDAILPYLQFVTPAICLITLLLVVLLHINAKKRFEEFIEDVMDKNAALNEKVKNIATKDDLSLVSAKTVEGGEQTLQLPDFTGVATRDDLLNLLNNIGYLREEVATLQGLREEITELKGLREEIATLKNLPQTATEKPKSALNGHKAEKELEVYEKIWQATGDLYIAVEKLQPTVDSPIAPETEAERWKRKYDEVITSYQKLYREAENQRIFYPKELYDQLQIMLREVKNEVVLLESSLKWNDTLPISERNRNTESLDRIREEVEHVYDFMKGRLNQL
jgi:hypothetical protein